MENCLRGEGTKEMYQQCTLRKTLESGATLTRTIWAPQVNLSINKEVKVEEDNGEWTTGWVVTEIHGEPVTKKIAEHTAHAYTRQRRASDI